MSDKIAIAGDGICGTYLYRLLTDSGYDVDIYGKKKVTYCKTSSCGWGTTDRIYKYWNRIGIDASDYILTSSKKIKIGNGYFEWDYFSFDKPRLISDLMEGVSVLSGRINLDNYTRIIDATGVDRVYLPRIKNDRIATTWQKKILSFKKLELEIIPHENKLGYQWIIPLNGSYYHIGNGFLDTIEDSQFFRKYSANTLCSCNGQVRISSPYYSRPFYNGNVVGVGEAIGVVGPIGGEGITHGLESCEMLLNNLDNLEKYESVILKKFKWMKKERELQDKLLSGGSMSILDALRFVKCAKMVGIKINLKSAWNILKKGENDKRT